jgi:hypothetical protein
MFTKHCKDNLPALWDYREPRMEIKNSGIKMGYFYGF